MSPTFKYVKLGITIGWPLLAGGATLLGSYKALIYETVNQRHLIQENHNKITKINSDIFALNLYHKHIKENLSHTNMTITILNDEVKDLKDNLKKNNGYQQVLRTEVQALAENKLNISEFWHYVNLINFEEEKYYVGHLNSKS